MPDDKTKLVYSTDKAVTRKGKPAEDIIESGIGPAGQKAIVRLDRKARNGKSVTVVEGLRMPQKEREALLRQLKVKLGTGGTVQETSLEIQGDHRDALMAAMEKMGYRPKRSGG